MAEVASIAFQPGKGICFMGAKVTVFVGTQLVTVLRDDIAGIPMPGHWDMPGGGREHDESAWDCAARECYEETCLQLDPADLLWGRPYRTGPDVNWFFVARVDAARACELALGDEGQQLVLMSTDAYLTHPKAVPHFQKRLADWLGGCAFEATLG